jgi:hypothetical protein
VNAVRYSKSATVTGIREQSKEPIEAAFRQRRATVVSTPAAPGAQRQCSLNDRCQLALAPTTVTVWEPDHGLVQSRGQKETISVVRKGIRACGTPATRPARWSLSRPNSRIKILKASHALPSHSHHSRRIIRASKALGTICRCNRVGTRAMTILRDGRLQAVTATPHVQIRSGTDRTA